MLSLLKTPLRPAFTQFAESILTDCFICSPYITSGPMKMLVKTVTAKKSVNIQINILTDISYRTLVHGATEILALLHLFKNYPNVCVTYLPKIHAKVYIANRSTAMITSANFTHGGGMINFEYGVKISDRAVVQKIQEDMNEYKKLGANITQNQLESIHDQVGEIKRIIEDEQKHINRTIKLHSIDLKREIEDNLIRVRVKDKSVNSIFSETLLYLLSKSPSETRELHTLISSIHPDLCDDSTDRVIDGRHFGKLWKHQVRGAQVHLRRTGAIFYNKDTKLWHKTIK